MAAYLALRTIDTKELRMGRDLIEVDNELCAALGVEPDDDQFYRGWVDLVGFALACGKSFDEAREVFKTDADLQRVIGHLESRYTNDSYHGR